MVVVSDYPGSLTALWRAAGEAAQRSAHLCVVDVSSNREFEDAALSDTDSSEARWRTVALSILRNPNVTISRIDLTGPGDLFDYCSVEGASLLVVDMAYFKEASRPGAPLGSLGADSDIDCDLLVVHEGPLR